MLLLLGGFQIPVPGCWGDKYHVERSKNIMVFPSLWQRQARARCGSMPPAAKPGSPVVAIAPVNPGRDIAQHTHSAPARRIWPIIKSYRPDQPS
jgi:hypothetical protein